MRDVLLNNISLLYWEFSGFLIVFPSMAISCTLPKKTHFFKRMIFCMVIVCGSTAVSGQAGYIFMNSLWLLSLLHIYSLLVLWFCSKCSLRLLIYYKIWSTLFNYLLTHLSHLMASVIDEKTYFEHLFSWKILCTILFIPFIVIVFKQITAKQPEQISWWFVFQSGVILAMVVLLNSSSFQKFNTLSGLIFMFQTCSTLCVILILYIQVEISYRQKIQMESKFMEHLWHMEQKQFEEKKEQIDLINRKCHDLKHHIAALKYVPDEKTFHQNIHELKKTVEIYDSTIQSGNIVLDTILAEKKNLFDEYHAKMVCMIDGAALAFMDAVDLYILLGNTLDNAFESIIKIADEQKRTVDIKIFKKKKFLRMIISNPYEGTINMRNGLPASTKKQDGYHGFGIKSIKHIVEKYKGNLCIKTEDQCFVLMIMIPLL